jgi:hypothetical protein
LSPILGIIASQNYPRITSSYESIATVILGSAQSSIDFTSIPSTYKHLQIRGIARSANSAAAEQGKLQMNGDTSASNYAFHSLKGNGSSASAEGYGTGVVAGVAGVFRITANTAPANTFGVTVVDILDYTNTNKYKTVRILTGQDSNGSGDIQFNSGLWLNTAAVTSLSFTMQGSGNFMQYSSFALYGVKG